MREVITPLILTFNEAPNLRQTLQKLTWARQIVVVDSFSTDETEEVAKSFVQVRFVQRKFDTHSAQWNYGLDLCSTLWVLSLDADYVLSEELVRELQSWQPTDSGVAWYARFRYCIQGRPLRGTLYPPRAVLFRKDRCRYEQDGHTQRLEIEGGTGWLQGYIDHDDRKPLDHWLAQQSRYALLEAKHLLETPAAELNRADRIRRKVILAPAFVFFYTLLGMGLILDGWAGWFYVLQRVLAEIMLSLRLIEAKMASGEKAEN
jgi:glycosyltransferase involved in cell wall biosynthesis